MCNNNTMSIDKLGRRCNACPAGLMVEHGFRVHAENKPEGSTLYTPGAEWNGKYANEWVFNFRRYVD